MAAKSLMNRLTAPMNSIVRGTGSMRRWRKTKFMGPVMRQYVGQMGAWNLTVLAIIIASWVIYRYFAPSNWREWASAGIVQAFIISLYAEMYGFPLTVYLAVRFFGMDRGDLTTNLWSSLLGFDEAMVLAMLLGYALALVGICLIVGGWRELYRNRKKGTLATGRLYKFVRHPQYLGLFIVLFGEGVVHWPTLLSVSLLPFIMFFYIALAKREEETLERLFGKQYALYKQDVPAFVPRWDQLRDAVMIWILFRD